MPKARSRRRRGESAKANPELVSQARSTSERTSPRPRGNPWSTGLVALGLWGLAITFLFLVSTENHVLWGTFSALMAVMWTVLFWKQVRPILRNEIEK